jgi:hypothetical protein
VWKPEQIGRLFDSLMQGYPFGTFLFWKVEPATSGKFKFYDFVLNYHQRDAAHCPELPALHNQAITAVLDGQQRLTALNIGLRGSMAIKQPNKWWNNPDAFPKRTLRLNLFASLEPDEDGVVYDFCFLDDAQAMRTEGALWFKVPDILGMKDGPAMLNWLVAQHLIGDDLSRAYAMLDRLHRVIHTEPVIYYYEEEAQDLERVLNIFIRLNSGGTVLSYSDLLLSIAVAQWKQVDARAEIHKLVDELNRIGTGFDLSQDFVLKAGLMLADIASVGFKVENFTNANMATLEAHWSAIRNALVRTVELVASFGLNGQTLRADSALLPIAYYLYARSAADNYVTLGQYAADRETIRRWLACSLLKASGVWGSGLDTLLTALREVIQKSGKDAFPDGQLRQEMESRSKSLTFAPAEIDDLLSMQYGDKRLFALLSLLFTFVDLPEPVPYRPHLPDLTLHTGAAQACRDIRTHDRRVRTARERIAEPSTSRRYRKHREASRAASYMAPRTLPDRKRSRTLSLHSSSRCRPEGNRRVRGILGRPQGAIARKDHGCAEPEGFGDLPEGPRTGHFPAMRRAPRNAGASVTFAASLM